RLCVLFSAPSCFRLRQGRFAPARGSPAACAPPRSTRDRFELCHELTCVLYRPRFYHGEFDFGDEGLFRRACDLFMQAATRRFTRAHPSTPIATRLEFGYRAILYRLKAKFNVRDVAEREVRLTGWDRTDYAPK